ncbi:MAG TPA: Grx4 family monothiol glutaredoxin [Gammaproteobacteria bacterium]|nr:Grx4 family monothiol glutaredoxin [Gammaproteobacteria bacterium]
MTVFDRIKQQLAQYPIVLYMKGTPIFPQCGFSSKASKLLQECLKATSASPDDVLYVNVLEDDEIREGIKQYANWPTIPQLYIKGELIGGSDILGELHSQGELMKLVQAAFKEERASY